jgi:opacity protein-like surface antigen
MRSAQFFAKAILFTCLAALTGAAARAQTSIAASLYGAFNASTSGNGTQQSPANQGGGLFEFRQIKNPLVGYEATYSYNRANQSYFYSFVCPCGQVGSYTESASVPANAHEITGDWLVSLRVAKLRPFALAGGGLLLNVPSASSVTLTTRSITGGTSSVATRISAEAVFVYGAGLDWELLPHLGLRLQYRGNVYKASDLSNVFTSTNAFTRTSEPMIGVFFRL